MEILVSVKNKVGIKKTAREENTEIFNAPEGKGQDYPTLYLTGQHWEGMEHCP